MALALGLVSRAPARPSTVGHEAASFSVGIRVRPAGTAFTAEPSDLVPEGMQRLAATPGGAYWLSPGGLETAARGYRDALAERGIAPAWEQADGSSWETRWRDNSGRCYQVNAQQVTGVRAVRLVERAVACD